MFCIDGKKVLGCGAATSNLKKQFPLIEAEFPEIANCYPGSINLELNAPLLIICPDHKTKPIAWESGSQSEQFDFLRVELEAPVGSCAVSAWLYIPHLSPHRRNLFIHEVITKEKIEGLAADTGCRIKINRQAIQIPWNLFPVVIVL